MPDYNITTHRLTSAATVNATSVAAKPVRLLTAVFSNTNAAARFIKLYDKAAAPTVGTDVPVLTVPLPAGALTPVPLNMYGLDFSVGLAYAITGVGTDADATAVAAGDVKVNLGYA